VKIKSTLPSIASTNVDVQPPPAKKVCSLFAHYRRPQATSAQLPGHISPQQQLSKYLDLINSPDFNLDNETSMETIFLQDQFKALRPLFEYILCTPATSAPVERIFSKSGIIMRPHRARMSDTTLETLMFLTCNTEL
jgi:hypothetical protein